MTLKTLPENLTTMVENFTDSTPLGDLLSAAITLAQYRVVGYDTFAGATKLRGLITPHTLVAETAQKAGIGLKQCVTAGASDGAGVFDELRAMNEADFATWLGSTDRKQTLAGALETVVTVLASPGFAASLVNEYSLVSAAIGETPATVTARGDDLEALRRIAVAYNGFLAGHNYYDDPASAWAGLNAVATAAKNQQAIGDPASMGEAYAQTAQALHALLSDAVLIRTVASNQVTMSAWVDQPAIMSAVWDSQVAAAECVSNPVAVGELVELAAGGGVRVGFTLMLSSELAALAAAHSDLFMTAVAQSQVAMTAVAQSQVAMAAIAASQVAMAAIAASQVARDAIWADSGAASEVLKSSNEIGLVAYCAQAAGIQYNSHQSFASMAANSTAMQAVADSSTAMHAVSLSATARTAISGNANAFTTFIGATGMEQHQVKYALLEAGSNDNLTTWQAVAASSTAMQAVAASSTAMRAVAASATSRSAIEASTNAYTALSASPLVQNLQQQNPASGTSKTFATGRNYYVVTYRQNNSDSSSYYDRPVDNAFNGGITIYGNTGYGQKVTVNRFTDNGILWYHSGYSHGTILGYFRCIPC